MKIQTSPARCDVDVTMLVAKLRLTFKYAVYEVCVEFVHEISLQLSVFIKLLIKTSLGASNYIDEVGWLH